LKPENKFALTVYLWGAITGIVSGALSVQNRAAWVLGALMFLITDVFIRTILKDDLPEELRGLRVRSSGEPFSERPFGVGFSSGSILLCLCIQLV